METQARAGKPGSNLAPHDDRATRLMPSAVQMGDADASGRQTERPEDTRPCLAAVGIVGRAATPTYSSFHANFIVVATIRTFGDQSACYGGYWTLVITYGLATQEGLGAEFLDSCDRGAIYSD
jgi:hypothetical protein